MPLFILVATVILLPLLIVVSTPFLMVQRYRTGTARRQARSWVAALNVAGMSLSVVLFLVGAAITNFWIPQVLAFSVLGLVSGGILGVAGVKLTRWDIRTAAVHYTPNRWLVLSITVAVAGRLAFGLWRAWDAWNVGGGEEGWIAASGLAGSMAAGALVLGYYLAFWTGVWIAARGRRQPL